MSSARSRMKSRLTGAASTRKLLRQIPEAAKLEMQDILTDAGSRLLREMRADVPNVSGRLARGLDAKLLKASLRLRVGILGKAKNRDLFYGRIVEFGRKAQTVPTRATKFKKSYKLRVRAMAPRPFVFKGRPETRAGIGASLRTFWEKTLASAAQGVGDD